MNISDQPLAFASLDHRLHQGRLFGIRPPDLLRHVYVIGKTGVGKTTLLERLFLAQLDAGMGCGLIDPHGDLAEHIIERVPRSRTNDVVYVDPADLTYPVGFNVLEASAPHLRGRVASNVLSVFRKVFAEFWGPRTEHLLRNCLLALLEVPGTTLLGVLRLLGDDRYREGVAARLRDPVVRRFWMVEFARYPAAFKAEVLAPVENKISAVLTNPLLRNIVGQPRSAFSCRDLIDEGRILIANLSKGRLGEDASNLLGAILVAAFQLAAYSRAEVSPEARRPFTLYVDEFASFVTPSFQETLSEARKYGLGLVLAHQHLNQLDGELRHAVLGNVGTLIAFRVGAEDAQVLAKEFEPELTAHDLTRLPPRHVALRLAVEGTTSDPFTAVTLPRTPVGDAGRGEIIRRISAERFGRHRDRVEAFALEQLGTK